MDDPREFCRHCGAHPDAGHLDDCPTWSDTPEDDDAD